MTKKILLCFYLYFTYDRNKINFSAESMLTFYLIYHIVEPPIKKIKKATHQKKCLLLFIGLWHADLKTLTILIFYLLFGKEFTDKCLNDLVLVDGFYIHYYLIVAKYELDSKRMKAGKALDISFSSYIAFIVQRRPWYNVWRIG